MQTKYIENESENADKILRELVTISRSDFKEKSETEDIERQNIPNSILKNANNYFLLKILSPEIKHNEDKKRKHKDNLIKIVKIFLIAQFSILFILLTGIVSTIFIFHGLKNDISLEYIKTIFNFVSIYITSVVVELIAMFKYIISNVFDTSITGLVEMYKDTYSKDENG